MDRRNPPTNRPPISLPTQGVVREPARVQFQHSIETAYRAFLFRSRLEAKWAAFFDQCGWAWSYEPKDYGGWIPDFAIGERPVLVEVKPFFNDDEWETAKQKIVDSGCREPVVLFGADPTWNAMAFDAMNGSGAPAIARLFEYMDDEVGYVGWDLHFGITEGNGKLGLCPLDGGWWNVIWKTPASGDNKWTRVWLESHQCEEHLVKKWAYAANASRWMPVRDDEVRS